MKVLLAVCLLTVLSVPGLAQIEPDEYVALKTEFDRFKGDLSVQTEAMKVIGTKYDNLALIFGFQRSQNNISTKPQIAIFINQVLKDRKPVSFDDIDLLIDGKSATIGNVVKLKAEHVFASVYLQQFGTLTSYEQALEIARAKKVEMRIAGAEFTLQPKQVDALRRLLKRIDETLKFPGDK
jgi:hypothetical protein